MGGKRTGMGAGQLAKILPRTTSNQAQNPQDDKCNGSWFGDGNDVVDSQLRCNDITLEIGGFSKA